MSLTFKNLRGDEIEAALDDLANLRIEVFHEWPYLYDGDLEYERRYVESYRDNPAAILVAAYDEDRIVGAATGSPLADHASDFATPFAELGLPLESVFYCAESVLLPQYRGHGAGHRFFDLREEHAGKQGFAYSAFCSVIRPDDHPLKPRDARTLAPFWRKRGYAPIEGVIAHFTWKDVDKAEASNKALQFWMRQL